MVKKAKNTLVIIVVLIIIIIAFVILRTAGENKNREKLISGLVINKENVNKKNQITIETFGEKESEKKEMIFTIKDKTLWGHIEVGEYYFISYYEEMKKDKKELIINKVDNNKVFGKAYSNYLTKREEKKAEEVKLKEKDEDKEENDKEEKEKHIAIFPSTDKISTEGLTVLDSVDVDLNRDGDEETIELYTTAQRDSNGEILWDDGQKWFLIVKDEDKEYVLFDEYVQLGVLDYWVFKSKDYCYIVTLQTGSAVYKLSEYFYTDEKDAFIKKEIYNPEFLNAVYGSGIK